MSTQSCMHIRGTSATLQRFGPLYRSREAKAPLKAMHFLVLYTSVCVGGLVTGVKFCQLIDKLLNFNICIIHHHFNELDVGKYTPAVIYILLQITFYSMY